jgi:hypothetical protein
MLSKTTLGLFVLAGVLLVIPMENVMAAPAEKVEGVWACTAIRAGTIERPLLLTFNTDGTFSYSSGTTINSIIPGPVNNSGFHSRGGGVGQWTKIGKNVFNYKSVELTYDALGNLSGSFAVDSTQLLTSAGQLCSGRGECPNQNTSVTLVKYVFDQNVPDFDIVGTDVLLPAGSPANILCNRLSSGQGFPSLPLIPVP